MVADPEINLSATLIELSNISWAGNWSQQQNYLSVGLGTHNEMQSTV
jgi:hypothetical protein